MAERREWPGRASASLPSVAKPRSRGPHYAAMRAAQSYTEPTEGYDYEFVPTPDSKYECPICLLILREPCQTECGHRFCRACITRWLNDNEPRRCPADNEPITEEQLYPDNFAKREILSLSVRCPNSKHGCDTVVVLARLEEHEAQCPMAYQPCPLDCPSILFRKDIEEHVAKTCERRKVVCPLCHDSVLAGLVEIHHQKSCPSIKVSCHLCDQQLLRGQMKQHLDTDCPNILVKCVFSVWGCEAEMKRSLQANHQQDSAAQHLHLLSTAFCRYCLLQGIPPETLAASGRSTRDTGTMGAELAVGVTSLSQLMQRHSIGEANNPAGVVAGGDTPTASQRLSTGSLPVTAFTPQQHHQALARSASLGASAQVPRTSTDTNTSTSSTVTREDIFHFTSGHETKRKDNMGPYISNVEFRSLKDQNVLQDESLARHDQHILELQSKIHMLEHSNHEFKETVQYLEEKLSAFSSLESRACNGNFLWKVKNFSRLRREAEIGETTVLHSPSFYSSLYGYKMCVRVNLNGVDSARGTHMSIFVHFMQGEFDGVLDWPFTGKIILSVIDQNPICEIRRHIVETLSAKPNLAAFQRPVTQRNHKGFGYVEFVPLHILDSSSYVLNDVLIIKAQVVPTNFM